MPNKRLFKASELVNAEVAAGGMVEIDPDDDWEPKPTSLSVERQALAHIKEAVKLLGDTLPSPESHTARIRLHEARLWLVDDITIKEKDNA